MYLMVCTRDDFFTRKLGNLYQNWYMICAVNNLFFFTGYDIQYTGIPTACINEFQVRPWSKRINGSICIYKQASLSV